MAEEVGNALKSVLERMNQAAARRQKVGGLGGPPGRPGPGRGPGVPEPERRARPLDPSSRRAAGQPAQHGGSVTARAEPFPDRRHGNRAGAGLGVSKRWNKGLQVVGVA